MDFFQLIGDTSVLIVEDEYLIADDLTQDLKKSGVTIIGPVATLDEAFAAVSTRRPDLAVLDINLRGQSVFPLADLLTARHVPYVFVTGYNADAVPDRFGAIPLFEKPVRAGELLDALIRLQTRPADAKGPLPGSGGTSHID